MEVNDDLHYPGALLPVAYSLNRSWGASLDAKAKAEIINSIGNWRAVVQIVPITDWDIPARYKIAARLTSRLKKNN
jgi:hypothetical protein